MPQRTLILTLALLTLPIVAWSLTLALPPVPHADLSEDELFARIDSLHAIYIRSEGPPRADTAYQLARLYLATGMPKHNARAQDLLDEATAIQPTRADAAYLAAISLSRMGYQDQARARLESLISLQPDSVGHRLMLARLTFVNARQMAHAQRMA
ncbi:hypothetical protein DRQ53_13265, partial [bacterium]